uniref:7TM_GPCR_Srx domain-containing protein n=1 Tax=Caenorhabditis japonica TaxID=281687 RepID=A0A8R1DQY6_CAEJA
MYLVRGYFTVSILYVLFSYNCPIFLSLETFGSTFEDPNCAMVLYTDDGSNDTVAYFLIFFAVTVGINLLTFAKILNFYFRQKLDAERLRSARKNIRSFFQTILQDSLFFVDVLFTFKLRLIMLMFSERIAIIKSRFKKKTKKIASHGPIYDIRSNSMPQIG